MDQRRQQEVEREVERLLAVRECYRVVLSCSGGPPPSCCDVTLRNAMECCLEDLGEPVHRTAGVELSRAHQRLGISGVLTPRAIAIISRARDEHAAEATRRFREAHGLVDPQET